MASGPGCRCCVCSWVIAMPVCSRAGAGCAERVARAGAGDAVPQSPAEAPTLAWLLTLRLAGHQRHRPTSHKASQPVPRAEAEQSRRRRMRPQRGLEGEGLLTLRGRTGCSTAGSEALAVPVDQTGEAARRSHQLLTMAGKQEVVVVEKRRRSWMCRLRRSKRPRTRASRPISAGLRQGAEAA